jgi:hypothetical protein
MRSDLLDTGARMRGAQKFPRGSVLRNELGQCQVRDRSAWTAILRLELLEAFDLLDIQLAVFLPPPIIAKAHSRQSGGLLRQYAGAAIDQLSRTLEYGPVSAFQYLIFCRRSGIHV